ncbi:DUF1275 family protein [Marinivivus vitaminiproducens]|uniref:DUF1275 family protein n=1 Tax=Marinivivus vitaminiproducens TaxID=3035935 RepID=UPI00279BED28|nr:YoaK family protein [Geminicoccaceae bacterium SCSIO 64248]
MIIPWRGWLLCFIAGQVDALGWLHFEAFPANMTGNTVLLSAFLVRGDLATAWLHGATLLAFMGGVVLARSAERASTRPWPGQALAVLLLLAAVLVPSPDHTLYLMAAAMGAQASAWKRFGSWQFSTVVLTSSLVKLAEHVVDGSSPAGARQPERREALVLLPAVLAYMAGAAAGVGLSVLPALPFAQLALPVMLLLLVTRWRQSRVSGVVTPAPRPYNAQAGLFPASGPLEHGSCPSSLPNSIASSLRRPSR